MTDLFNKVAGLQRSVGDAQNANAFPKGEKETLKDWTLQTEKSISAMKDETKAIDVDENTTQDLQDAFQSLAQALGAEYRLVDGGTMAQNKPVLKEVADNLYQTAGSMIHAGDDLH